MGDPGSMLHVLAVHQSLTEETHVTSYRFLDAMGDVVAQEDFVEHAAALRWALDDDGPDEEVQRVEYRGPEGDWRWAGALHT